MACQDPHVLSLLEFREAGQLQEAALQLAFPSRLLPHVALDISGPQPRLYAITARGILHAISLPGMQPPASASRALAAHGQQQGGSQLAGVSADSSITSIDLSSGACRHEPVPAAALCTVLALITECW